MRLTPSREILVRAIAVLLISTARQVDAQLCASSGIDEQMFKRIIRERFSSLLAPTSKGVPGSFAALDIKESDVTFAGSTLLRSGVAIVAKAHGGITEGFLNAISNQSVSSKFGAELQGHFLSGARQSIQYDNESCNAYKAAYQKAAHDDALRQVEIAGNYPAVLQLAELAALDAKIVTYGNAIAAGPAQGTPRYRIDSLQVELTKAQTMRAQIQARVLPSTVDQRFTSSNQMQADRKKGRKASSSPRLQHRLMVYQLWCSKHWVQLVQFCGSVGLTDHQTLLCLTRRRNRLLALFAIGRDQ